MDLPLYPCNTQDCSEEPGPSDGEDFERKRNRIQKSFHSPSPSNSSSAPPGNRMKKMSHEWTFAKQRPQITRTLPSTSQCHQQPVITKVKEQGSVGETTEIERLRVYVMGRESLTLS